MQPFVEDTWLSETLSMPVFRLAQPASAVATETAAAAMSQLCAKADRAFFFAKIPTIAISACRQLCSAGFAVVDTAITFAHGGRVLDRNDAVSVEIARPEHHDAVAHIAETAFRWSRFHLDPRIPNAAANLVKRRWIENYLNGKRGSGVYVATMADEVAGFLAVLEATSDGRTAAAIDLIAVRNGSQGRGVGAALVSAFVSDWRDKVQELRVGTQAANIQSLRFYEGNGFRVAESTYVLHAHSAGGTILR